ncbi:MAG: cysteine hydrolase [Ignavibacteriae bacterium]|nr:cysteine hydrolase [Ignavibacteriota bacterium]
MEQSTQLQSTALLVLDVQDLIIKMMKNASLILEPLTSAIKTARANNIPVIYVLIKFREGYPEVSPNNKTFMFYKNSTTIHFDTEEGSKIHEAVAPQPGDIVIEKKRTSAFTGGDLEVVLRAKGINHLVLTGLITSGVVLSTVREAADKDYRLSVLSDCCADIDEEVHRVLTTKIFPRQTEVMTSGEWVDSFGHVE